MIYLNSDDVLLFQGDSITHGGRVESDWDMNHVIGHGYQDYVAQVLGVDNVERAPKIVNRGVSGDTVVNMLNTRIKQDIIDIKPTILSMLIGVNDASHIAKGEYSTAKYNESYRRLLDEVIDACPGVKLIICQPFRYAVTDDNKEIDKKVEVMNEIKPMAEQIAKDYNAVFVRFGDVLDEYVAKYPLTQIVWDGVHPTYVGHGIMAKCWLETVEKAYNK